jgi:hypothetical protein
MKKFTLVTIFILCLALQLYAQKKPEIDRNQFKISAEKVEFSEDGGNKKLSVTADNEWSIKSRPDSWVTVSKNGNTLQLSAGKNNSTKSLTTNLTITSKNKDIKIKITQSAASILEVSPKSAHFEAGGGTKYFTVNSTKSWSIGTSTTSFGHLDRNGNTLTLRVNASKQTSPRTDYFIINSGSKSVRVDISQSAAKIKSNTNTPTKFSISSSSANFSSNGGSKTFTVTSSNPWRIETGTASWGRLSKNGNNLTLTVDANKTEKARNDWFSIKSGNRTIRIDISQAGASSRFEISATSANFSAAGGSKTFTVISTDSWHIDKSTSSWGHLTKDGNSITLSIDANTKTTSRTDYFTIKSGNKVIRVNISQAAAAPFMTVNGSSEKVSLYFDSENSKKHITVNTNIGGYEIWGKPSWCYISNRTQTGFDLGCLRNNSSEYRSNYLEVRASGKNVRISIFQDSDDKKYWRKRKGGWVNMAIGLEGGYCIKEGSWYSNSIIGMRIGNYGDLFQFELGVAPGVVSCYDSSSVNFHLPVYASLKLSATNGSFYFKMGGAYNAIRDDDYEGNYSLRAGFGSAWKHFEWDWAFIQFNAPGYNDNKDSYIFDSSNMMVGMRMAWYITR